MTLHRQNLNRNELIENKEEFRIIWLDANIDNSDDSVKTQKILLEFNPAAQFYTDSIQCINVIESIISEQILFIISGSFARIVLPQIHHIQSIIAIFIFCINRENYMSLKNDYNKIIEVFIDQDNLLESIRQTLNLLEKQAIAFSLFDQKQKSSQDLSKESASFLWHQLILHVLEKMPQNEQSKKDLLDKCEDYYQFNKGELNKIDKFRKDYCREKAIEWYTDECFLYKLLNKALRTENIELIYSFRFFIIDLCFEIKQEQVKSKTDNVFTTYRGQTISIAEFNKWKNNIGTTISINGFFSTSLDINRSLSFARRGVISNDMLSILFEIEVDPSIKTIVYADIRHKAQYPEEQEILFNLNSLFKIISVDFDLKSQIGKIQLKTTDEGAQDVDERLKYIQQEIDECSPIIYFGWLLLNELGQIDQAERYFTMLIKTLPPDHEDIASAYNGVGCVHSRRNDFNLALKNYEIAFKIRQERLPPNHSRIAASLHNIAGIFKDIGHFDQALDYYQKALEIEENNHPGDHLQKAVIIQNIGNAYIEKGDLGIALNHLSRALDMLKRILPKEHPKISTCLGNIGLVYEKQGNFKKALEYYHEELEMDEHCLPSDHPYLSKDLKIIVHTYKNNGEMKTALEFCRKKLDIQKNNLGNNHTRIAQTLIAMGKVLEDDYFEEPLRYYEEALDNLKKSIPIDQRAIAECLTDMGYLCRACRQYDLAQKYLFQVLDLYKQLSLTDHIDIAGVCKIIALCYQRTNKLSEALEYYKESLRIYRVNYGSDHKDVKSILDDIDKLNVEQQTITNSVEPVGEQINDEQQTTTNNTESVEENTVIVDFDARPSIVEPSPPPANDSASTSQADRNKIKNKTKTSGKRKICSDCVIL